MKKLTFAVLSACLLVAGCDTMDGSSGYLTQFFELGRLLAEDDETTIDPSAYLNRSVPNLTRSVPNLTASAPNLAASEHSLTASEHNLTASERATLEAGVRRYYTIPVRISGLKSSYRPADRAVAVCGYVSSLNQPSITPVLFAGTLLPSGSFVMLPAGIGRG